jgi:A118 family predicted phage portal protein
MLQKILAWIREVWSRMIGQTNIKTALGVDIPMSTEMITALDTWSLMYKNQSPWLTDESHGLGLAAEIAGEIARITTIEMDVELSGSARADYLKAQLEPVERVLREMVEYGNAKGGLIFKPYVTAAGTLAVDYVQADQFYPIAFDGNKNITAAVFADQKQVGDKFYTRLEYHSLSGTIYTIRNLAFVSQSRDTLGSQVSLTTLPAWENLQPEVNLADVEKPLYGYYRYPLANNIDTGSALGVSCYARAVDLIEDADTQWANFLWEFESGKRAMYVDVLAFDKHPTTGKAVLPDKRFYRALNGVGNIGDSGKLFEDWSPTLREQNILAGLDAILKQIEFACGLAYGTISNPQTVDKTATEIKISRQRTYATVTDCQKSLKTAIDGLLYAMDVYCTLYGLAPAGSWQSVYTFDDSVISDKDVQWSHDMQALDRVMSKIEFRMRNYGETEEVARKKLAMVQEEQASMTALFPA